MGTPYGRPWYEVGIPRCLAICESGTQCLNGGRFDGRCRVHSKRPAQRNVTADQERMREQRARLRAEGICVDCRKVDAWRGQWRCRGCASTHAAKSLAKARGRAKHL